MDKYLFMDDEILCILVNLLFVVYMKLYYVSKL